MSEKSLIPDIRREYSLAGLCRADLDPDPIAQFSKWFEQARAAEVPEVNAMTLATVDAYGQPSARIVLLKELDQRGFIFFTNYESRKGRELTKNPRASLVFFWPQLERQVCVQGSVAKVPREESRKYFNQRPRGSRLAVWVSRQTETIANREALEKRLAVVSALYPGEDVPLPDYWGGFCLAPTRIEFWQGRPNRLHDRFQYLTVPAKGWEISRLSP